MKIDLDISKVVDVEFDGIYHSDCPDYCDAYITKASYKNDDGSYRDLTEDECQWLQDEFGGVFKNVCLAVSGQGAYQCWYFKDKDGFVVRSTILCVVDYGPEEDFPIGIENNLTDWCPLCCQQPLG